ncbi:extracellular solute-binding protein [Litchfieldia salsa]|uniref:Carbohydrate ABC transporter substrate-binding protein, CUT1 family n=1 Tax=Litchfieldia salsa TaxID=930152 RepID=A0A1H0VLL7_9BACI|nr:extracellular solute-binding protein [Litchfieldia salsa]SDP79407.1 carbohydrate ABC transporter substrate-binding protein, CUT1 family [Litchfieldia salsa]
MKMKWRFSILTITIILLVGSLVACSNQGANSSKEDEPSDQSGGEEAKLNIVEGKIEPAITLTTIIAELNNTSYVEGESITDNAHTQWVEEKLGINIESQWEASVADGSFAEKLKLGVASKQELPDFFWVMDEQLITMLIESGLVLDSGEAFDKYASDTYKAALAEAPESWYPYMADGKRFGIPNLAENQTSQPVLWVRQDWLDKLGLEAPTNLQELEVVMEAFATQDPDGNGKNDTIPLGISGTPNFAVNPVPETSWVFGMFGAIPEIWTPGEGGKLEYGSVQPEIKDALAKLRDWKEKGYLNEVALSDFNTFAKEVTTGNIGILAGPNWSIRYPISMLMQTNPGARYMPYELPVGADGKGMHVMGNNTIGAVFFNKDISEEKIQAFFHYQNTMHSIYDSEDPYLFKDFQDGYDYVLKDGKADLIENRVQSQKYMLTGNPPTFLSKIIDAKVKAAKGEELSNLEQSALNSNGDLFNAMDTSNPLNQILNMATVKAVEQENVGVTDYFSGPPTKTMTRRWEMLNRSQMETYTDIIYGKKPIEAFDEFVENWYSSGGEDITKEVNEWYDSVSK